MFRVLIVGRPNVGKSTLFNRLCRSRKAIVGNEPGITRDHIYGTVSWKGKRIEFVDSGGMMPNVTDIIPTKILQQVEATILESDMLLLVVDRRDGITSLDEQLLPILRTSGRPVWVAVNKIDTVQHEPDAAVFYSWGFPGVFSISAEHNRGIAGLLDALAEQPGVPLETEGALEREIAVAVVGRPNVGKSSLVNRLLGLDRCIVSEIPGTTRDAVDTLLIRAGIRYRLIDTAGIRRKGKTQELTEKISVVMARKNLKQADVALLLLDSEEGVTKLDAAIGGYAHDAGCSVIIVLNKWDRVQKNLETFQQYTDSIRRRMKYLTYAPILTVSARSGQRVTKLFGLIRRAHEGRKIRIPSSKLNNVLVPDLARKLPFNDPSHKRGIRYITQTRDQTPTFLVVVSGRKPLHFSTERFLINQLRDRFGFFAAPIRIRQRLKISRGRNSANRGD